MRVACIYLPSFPLQVLVRTSPHLAGVPLVVTDGRSRPKIVAASRAAWAAGIRPGMTPAKARRCAADLEVRPVDPLAARATIDALAECLLGASPLVDIGADDTAGERPHKALFVEVPHGSRGATFGDKLIAAASRQGLRARIGIADDRFTAWCAAAAPRPGDVPSTRGEAETPPFAQSCTTVPRGGSAVFLAPLPLSLLPLSDEVRAVLVSLRVATIGDFGALPPPTINRRHARWADNGVDVHELARGAGPSALRRFEPSADIVERLTLADPALELEPIAFLLHPVVDRVAERLRGRARAASGLCIRLHGDGAETELRIPLPSPTASGRAMLDAIRQRVIATRPDHAVSTVAVSVIAETEPEVDELELFNARPHRRTRRGKRNRSRSRQQALPLALD